MKDLCATRFAGRSREKRPCRQESVLERAHLSRVKAHILAEQAHRCNVMALVR
jgi:hypothetical protein